MDETAAVLIIYLVVPPGLFAGIDARGRGPKRALGGAQRGVFREFRSLRCSTEIPSSYGDLAL